MADTRTDEPTVAPDLHPAKESSSYGVDFWLSKRTIAAILMVLFVLGCGLWLLLTDPSPSRPAAQDPGAASVPPGSGAGCGPAAGSQIPPTSTPITDWVLLGTMASPTSPTVGPDADASGVPVCFSRDPLGALFAAATFTAASSDPELRFLAVRHLTAATEGQRIAMADIALNGPGDVSTGLQIAGFAFQSYVPGESAVIDLVLRLDGQLVHIALEVAWAGTDWDVVLPVTGSPFDNAQPLPNLAGYISLQGA